MGAYSNYLLILDGGHGMDTAGKRTPDMDPVTPGVQSIKENQFNSVVVKKIQAKALALGLSVGTTEDQVNDVALSTRSKKANDLMKLGGHDRNSCILVSVHFNAFNGVFDGKSGGLETYHYPNSTQGLKLATAIHNEVIQGTPQFNRGVKSANFHMLRETLMPAALVEFGFMDNRVEANLMLDEAFQEECAEETLKGICRYFDIPYKEHNVTMILDVSSATVAQCQAWAKSKGATDEFVGLAPIYFRLASSLTLDVAGAYAQAAKETGYGKFGGVIDATYHNPCGLKTTQGGGNYDPNAHKRFKDWEEGIQAHIDHLALYAGHLAYPDPNSPDPRHFPYIHGKAPSFEELGGKWAPNPDYGKSIVRMIDQIKAMKVDNSDMLKSEIEKLTTELDKMQVRAETAEKKLKMIEDIL